MLKEKSNVINLGCRLNAYESEVINDILKENNLNNITVINTCAVTNQAVKNSKLTIKKAKKEKPENKIFVTGCASQIETTLFKNMVEVDKIISNDFKNDKRSYLNNLIIDETKNKFSIFSQPFNKFKYRTRALLQIQQGCDHRCSFCIIPFGRGDSVSLPMGEIVNRVGLLLKAGYQEITLTGIDLTSYGNDIPGKPRLGQILKRLLKLKPDLSRVRLSSIDPAEVDEDLLDIFLNEKKFLPHIHFSVQSADDLILKRMKRRHSRNDLIIICEEIQKKRPEMTFGADIIVGFPTETNESFSNTLNFIKKFNFTNLHIFPFSPKQGTPAARMPQVREEIKKERLKILREIGNEIKVKKMKKKIGQVTKVLFETTKLSYTDDYFKLKVPSDNFSDSLNGKLVNVQFREIEGDFLNAEIIK